MPPCPRHRLPVEIPWPRGRRLERQTRAIRRPDRKGTGPPGREANARAAFDIDDPDIAPRVGRDRDGDAPASGENAGLRTRGAPPARGSPAVTVDAEEGPVGHGGVGRQIHERPCGGGDRKVGSAEPRRLHALEQRDGRLIQIAIGSQERGGDQPTRLRIDDVSRRHILGAFADARAAEQVPFATRQSQYRGPPRRVPKDAEERVRPAGQNLRIAMLGLAFLRGRDLNGLTTFGRYLPGPVEASVVANRMCCRPMWRSRSAACRRSSAARRRTTKPSSRFLPHETPATGHPGKKWRYRALGRGHRTHLEFVERAQYSWVCPPPTAAA